MADEPKKGSSRNERKKLAKERAKEEEAAPKFAPPNRANDAADPAAQRAQIEKQAAQPAPATVAAQQAVLDVEKQLKKLQKKLKAIQDLKEKDPGALDADQKAKLAGEAEVLAEIEKLSAAAPVKAASPKVSPKMAPAASPKMAPAASPKMAAAASPKMAAAAEEDGEEAEEAREEAEADRGSEEEGSGLPGRGYESEDRHGGRDEGGARRSRLINCFFASCAGFARSFEASFEERIPFSCTHLLVSQWRRSKRRVVLGPSPAMQITPTLPGEEETAFSDRNEALRHKVLRFFFSCVHFFRVVHTNFAVEGVLQTSVKRATVRYDIFISLICRHAL